MNKPDYRKDPNLSRAHEMNSGLFVIVIFSLTVHVTMDRVRNVLQMIKG